MRSNQQPNTSGAYRSANMFRQSRCTAALRLMVLLGMILVLATAFSPSNLPLERVLQRSVTPTRSSSSPVLLFARRPKQSSDNNDGFSMSSGSSKLSSNSFDFSLQELKVQCKALKKAQLPSRDLDPLKRMEIETYARTVCETVAQQKKSNDYALQPDQLPGSTWRLVFSTQSATMGDLPRGASVLVEFLDENSDNDGEKLLNYKLEFQKSLALQNLTAQSTYTVDQTTGLVTFVYQKITVQMFGLTQIGVGLFGLLKGRANYIETAYFDGTYWIERGVDITGDQDFINVYVNEE